MQELDVQFISTESQEAFHIWTLEKRDTKQTNSLDNSFPKAATESTFALYLSLEISSDNMSALYNLIN